MIKKILMSISICIVVVVLAYWYFFVNMNNLPKGELVLTCPSPNGIYTLNVYSCSGNATTAYSIRAEVVGKNIRRNIYWQYDEVEYECEWISNNVVCINGITLDVLSDVYDWRRAA